MVKQQQRQLNAPRRRQAANSAAGNSEQSPVAESYAKKSRTGTDASHDYFAFKVNMRSCGANLDPWLPLHVALFFFEKDESASTPASIHRELLVKKPTLVVLPGLCACFQLIFLLMEFRLWHCSRTLDP